MCEEVNNHLSTVIKQAKEIEDLDPEAHDEYLSYTNKIFELINDAIQKTENPRKRKTFETETYLTIESKWDGELLRTSTKTNRQRNFNKNNNLTANDSAQRKKMDVGRNVRDYIRSIFCQYGTIVDDDRMSNLYGINLPNHRIDLYASKNRIFLVTYIFKGNPKVQNAKMKKVKELINARKLEHSKQNSITGRSEPVIFYEIQEHKSFTKKKPIFNQQSINPANNQTIQKNDFVIFNVEKHFNRDDITSVIQKVSKADVSKIYIPTVCEYMQFPKNTWFVNTFTQLSTGQFKCIEKVLGGTVLPQALRKEDITNNEIRDQLASFSKGKNGKIDDDYYENSRPVHCDDHFREAYPYDY